MPVPDETISELQRLLAEDENREPEVPRHGIGFRRGYIVWTATGAWSINAPGYFYDEWEDDQATLVLWYGGRTIWMSSLSYSGKDGNPVSPSEGVRPGRDEPPDVSIVESVDNWLHRRYYVVENRDETGTWTLFGKVATFNTVCIVSIRFSDKSDQAWAESMFNSVSCPKPDDTPDAR
jgi:hypothetical protein